MEMMYTEAREKVNEGVRQANLLVEEMTRTQM
jgi:hypothetical protein